MVKLIAHESKIIISFQHIFLSGKLRCESRPSFALRSAIVFRYQYKLYTNTFVIFIVLYYLKFCAK